MIEEVAYLGYHLHWPHDDLMALEHRDRREWVQQVSALNTRINSSADQAV